MKIITTAALAATLVLTVAGPALADGDHGTRQAGQKGSPSSTAPSGNSNPRTIDMQEDSSSDLPQGILPRIMDQLL